jgi:hypothetical protein
MCSKSRQTQEYHQLLEWKARLLHISVEHDTLTLRSDVDDYYANINIKVKSTPQISPLSILKHQEVLKQVYLSF